MSALQYKYVYIFVFFWKNELEYKKINKIHSNLEWCMVDVFFEFYVMQ